MDVKQDNAEYKPPVVEATPKKTIWDYVFGVFSVFLIPLRFTRDKIKLIQDDNMKRRKFLQWRKRENTRYRRGNKLNDEF